MCSTLQASRYWTTEPDGIVEPQLGSGFAGIEPRTVITVFKDAVDKYGSQNALHLKRPVEPEWLIANNGAIICGCIAAGIYITNAPAACHYISGHSKAEVVVVEGNKQLAKYCDVPKSALPSLKAIVVYNEETLDESLVSRCGFPVYTWDAFMDLGDSVPDDALEQRQEGILPGNCATLIYTSGTTGPPKAVMVSHDNITWVIKCMIDEHIPNLGPDDRICSFLPLSHIAAQCVDVHIPMYKGCQLFFCQPDALKGSLTNTLKDARPTLFLAVPRVYEKVMEKMIQVGRENGFIKKMIAGWAKSVGAAHSESMEYGKAQDSSVDILCSAFGVSSSGSDVPRDASEFPQPWGYSLASSLVFQKVREAIGLDQCKNCFVSAAPISLETLKFFAALDIQIFEIFGQSECTGPHTVSSRGFWKMGTCGRPLPGTETKLNVGNGELCYRGRHIFMGYMYMPAQTAETIDDDGWLHSGDVAELDADGRDDQPGLSGFMRITGRIKELLVTAGGENVPPVLIENEVKTALSAVSNCVVLGDKKKFLSMLVSLKVEMDKETGAPTDQLAAEALYISKQIGSPATTLSAAAQDPLWSKYIEDGVKTANKKAFSNAQTIQKFRFLPADFSEKTGELTPTMKLKRKVVNEKYAAIIEEMYRGEETN